jgi:hypothetical protein
MEPAPERNTLITTAVPQWTRLVGAARAVGEVEVARAALRRMEATCGTGRRWPDRPLHAGVQTLGIHLLMRWGTPLSSAALAVRGYVPPKGPILVDAPADDILVTKARSVDGATLQLALRPRRDGPAHATLGFGALLPRRRYRLVLTGDVVTVESDSLGNATVDVTISGPVEASLDPVEEGPSS